MSAPRPPWRSRRALYVVGLLPSLLLLLLSVRIWVLLVSDADGQRAYDAEQYADAESSFVANTVLNPVEPWVARFNAGDALFRLGDHDAAASAFAEALEVAPAARECDVRLNLALSREAQGDAALEDGNRSTAEAAWQAGRTALGGCTTQPALEVDRRLEQKLGPVPPEPEPAEPPPPPEDLEEREEQLREKNERALEKRVRNEQEDTSRPAPTPDW